MYSLKDILFLQDLITCVSLFPPNHNLFMSGSRDSSVRVWDRRVERCVGEFSSQKGLVIVMDFLSDIIHAFNSSSI